MNLLGRPLLKEHFEDRYNCGRGQFRTLWKGENRKTMCRACLCMCVCFGCGIGVAAQALMEELYGIDT